MGSPACEQFFRVFELVEQVLLNLRRPTCANDVDEALAHIRELQNLRHTSRSINNLIQMSPGIKNNMNHGRLPDNDCACQVSAEMASAQLQKRSDSDMLWGYRLLGFHSCDIEADELRVLLYDIEVTSSNSGCSTITEPTQPLIASWSEMLLARPHVPTMVRLVIMSACKPATKTEEITFVLSPNATIHSLFDTLGQLLSGLRLLRDQLIRDESVLPRRTMLLPRNHSSSATAVYLVRRKKELCTQHLGWESCVHFEEYHGEDSSTDQWTAGREEPGGEFVIYAG